MENKEDFLRDDISIPDHVEMTEPLKIYLKEIGQIKPLDAEGELELGKRIIRGDMDARRQMEEANLRLVVSIAGRYTGRGMQFMDLVQEGNIGLMDAVENFDFTKGDRFAPYASKKIGEALRNAIDEQSREIRVPAQVAENMSKVQKISRVLKQELGRAATSAEIAERLGDKTPEEVENIKALLKNPLSPEIQSDGDSEAPYGDFAEDEEENAPEDAVASLIRKEEVAQLMEHLSEEEQNVIRLRFGLEDGKARTQEEVGEMLSLTGEHIRRTEECAMQKLREAAGKNA